MLFFDTFAIFFCLGQTMSWSTLSCLGDRLAVYDGDEVVYSYGSAGVPKNNLIKKACGNWTEGTTVYSSGNKVTPLLGDNSKQPVYSVIKYF